MFASDLLEDVPCPDPYCWRGYACGYNHDSHVLNLQKILNSIVGGESFVNNQTDTTDVDTEPAIKKQKLDDAGSESEPSLVNLNETENQQETQLSYLPIPALDSAYLEAPPDLYIPGYIGDDAGGLEELLKSSIDAVGKQLQTDDKSPEDDNSEYEPAFITPPVTGDKRKTSSSSVSKLRASIEDVGRQLSQLTRVNAMPRIGGSLPTTIADTEKQLNSSGSYNARKMMREKIMKDVENENFRELGGDTAGIAIEEKRVKTPTKVTSSKPIPSIQNKFLIKPPIQSNKPEISKPKVVKKKQEFLLNSDDEDEDEDEYEDEEEEEQEPIKNTKLKTSNTNININNKPLKPPAKAATVNSTLTKPLIKTPPKNTPQPKTTINTINKPTNTINKISPKPSTTTPPKNISPNMLKTIINTTSTNVTKPATTSEKPATKGPGLLAMGVGLTPAQAKAAQAMRADTQGQVFAGGLLSASEYPSILFELRPKVPRKVRQAYLDKFLIQFLTNFPENKTQAIEAAVKVESDINSEAQTKMVYVNLCVHKMRTLFPSV